jgi:putative ABC transport system permease protein
MKGSSMKQTPLFQAFILRFLQKNPLRTGLTVLGIALGVGILLAIHLANDSVLRNFRQSIETVTGPSNLLIVSQATPTFEESLLDELRWIWQTGGQFTPVLEQQAARISPVEAGRPTDVVQVLGINMLGDPVFRSFSWDAGSETSFSVLYENHGLFGKPLAQRALKETFPDGSADVSQLQSIPLLINEGERNIRVSGLLADEGLGGAYSGNLVLMDLAVAQQAFNLPGQISRIDLLIPEEHLAIVQEKLDRELPDTLLVQRPDQRGEQVEKMIQAFQSNLTALSFISLLVGMFLIYNTMSIAVLRRRPEIGTLRALGASKKLIFKLFSLEALTLGAIGTALGLLSGVGMAQLALGSVSQTVETLYVAQATPSISVTWGPLLVAGCLGMGLSFLAALPPVIEAMSVPPAEAARRRSDETRTANAAPKLTLIGVGLWGVALVAAFQPPIGTLPVFGYLSALCFVLGGALILPWFLQGVLRIASQGMHRIFGLTGHLAGLNLLGALGRTSVAVASLMVGIAMMISLAVMIGSFRQTVIVWVDQTFKADLLVKPAARITSKVSAQLAPAVVESVRTTPGVRAVDAFYEFPIVYNGMPTNLGVGEMETLFEEGSLLFLNGETPQSVYTRLKESPSVLVTETFALKNNLQKGDTVTLETPAGPKTLPIAGVYYDYASDQGYIILPRRLYREYYQDDAVSDMAVYLDPQADPEAVRTAIHQQVPAGTRLTISTQRDVKQEVLRIFDDTFAITYALHLIAITVAILGVLNTLLALVLESRRDFGILRYLGATRQQIRRIVLLQAGLLGILGNLTGLGVGFVLSLLLIHVINKQSFGWSIQLYLSWDFIAQSFALVMISALLSGWIPARMAAQLPAPSVVRDE